jgi:hypothetical protein
MSGPARLRNRERANRSQSVPVGAIDEEPNEDPEQLEASQQRAPGTSSASRTLPIPTRAEPAQAAVRAEAVEQRGDLLLGDEPPEEDEDLYGAGSGAVTPATSQPKTAESEANSTLTAEIQHYERLVALQRRKARLAALQAEYRGEHVDDPVVITGTELPVRKRPASMVMESGSLKIPRIGKEATFAGESAEELKQYVDYWKTAFEHPSWAPHTWSMRISTAAACLVKRALSMWSNRKEEPSTWEEYLEFLRSMIQSPANRMARAIRHIWRFRQKEDQSVREVLDNLIQLRADIPELSAEERRAWELLMALRPEISSEVQRELPEITSEDQVLQVAQRHEERLRATKKGSYAAVVPKQSAGSHSASAQHKKSGPPQQKSGAKPSSGKSSRPADDTTKCYKCNEFGHFAYACPQNAGSSSGARVVVGNPRRDADKKKESSGPPKK